MKAQPVKEYRLRPNPILTDSLLILRIETFFQNTLEYGIRSDTLPVKTDCTEVDSILKIKKLFWVFPIDSIAESINIRHEIDVNWIRPELRITKMKCFLCMDDPLNRNLKIIRRKAWRKCKEIKKKLDKHLE